MKLTVRLNFIYSFLPYPAIPSYQPYAPSLLFLDVLYLLPPTVPSSQPYLPSLPFHDVSTLSLTPLFLHVNAISLVC